jgi:hypothetical protein
MARRMGGFRDARVNPRCFCLGGIDMAVRTQWRGRKAALLHKENIFSERILVVITVDTLAPGPPTNSRRMTVDYLV